MTPKSVATIACRLLAMWFFVQAARDFVGAIANFVEYGFSPRVQSISSIVRLCVAPVIDLGAGVVLWLGAFVLADNMMCGMQNNSANEKEIEMVGNVGQLLRTRQAV